MLPQQTLPENAPRSESQKTIDRLLQEITQIDGEDDEFAHEAQIGTGNLHLDFFCFLGVSGNG